MKSKRNKDKPVSLVKALENLPEPEKWFKLTEKEKDLFRRYSVIEEANRKYIPNFYLK